MQNTPGNLQAERLAVGRSPEYGIHVMRAAFNLTGRSRGWATIRAASRELLQRSDRFQVTDLIPEGAKAPIALGDLDMRERWQCPVQDT